MQNILIVDFTPYRTSMANIFRDRGFRVEVCESAYQAMTKLKAIDFDLVVSEIELPGDNAFDLYNYIRKNYPYIPTIMTTDKNIDLFFDRIFLEGIGNVLCKPVRKDEITSLADKLISRKNIFGLQNYMINIEEMKKIRITSSKQIQNGIAQVFHFIDKWKFQIDNKIVLNLVLNEMLINAIYHSHGLTYEKEHRIPVRLEEGQFVDIFFAYNTTSYGISINDYNGMLSKNRILDSINSVVRQDNLILQALETGEDIIDKISETGRGLDLVRKLAGEYYFIIKKGVRTEIILIFNSEFPDNSGEFFSSLKIIEDYPETD